MKAFSKLFFILFLLIPIACSLLPITYSSAAVPHLINYQGRLTDSSGNPLNGTYNLTFRLYNAETGSGTMVPWEETHSGVSIQKGIFNILLGSITSINLPFDQQYWLEIVVNGEIMTPRQKITSAGYAIRAEKAESATQAENAITVGSVGVSTTPTANKLLPLDNTAKLPSAALKSYETVISFSANAPYTISHNLNTTKVIIQVFFRENSGAAWKIGSYLEEPDDDKSWQGINFYDVSSNSISFRIPGGICYAESNGNINWISSGQLRVIILALE